MGDLELRKEEGAEKREYIIWHTESGGSKTRSGAKEFDPERYFNSRIHATGNERCPVKFFKRYLARQPILLGSHEKSQRNYLVQELDSHLECSRWVAL